MGHKIYRSLVFVLPLLYSIQTRFILRSKLGIIVWITEFLIPVALAMFILGHWTFDIGSAIISIVAVYNLYEIGYIQNDCETIKHEHNPTKRHTKESLLMYEKWKSIIYLVRILIEIGLSFYLYNVSGVGGVSIISIWLVCPCYFLYNHIRNRLNLYMILLLTSYRYCFPLYLYSCMVTSESLRLLLVNLFLAYPLPKFIEICIDGKGNPPEAWARFFLPNFEERFFFRVKYYIILLIVNLLLSALNLVPCTMVLIPLYYFIIRLSQIRMKKLGGRSL